VREAELAKVGHAMATGDYDVANLTVGESVGLVHDVPKARDVVERTIAEAEARFEKFASGVAAKSAGLSHDVWFAKWLPGGREEVPQSLCLCSARRRLWATRCDSGIRLQLHKRRTLNGNNYD
jgi:hypothetical protein